MLYALFGIYSFADPTKLIETVTTDAKGNAKIDPKYAIKEY